MRREFDIIWNIQSRNLWRYFSEFRVTSMPSTKFISSDLRTGYKDNSTQKKLSHLCFIDSELYYAQWSTGSSMSFSESWYFHRIYDIDKFIKGEYSHWEMIKDSYECCDYFYMIEFSTRFDDATLDHRISHTHTNKYKIPTKSIPRNILPSVSDIVYGKFGTYNITREQEKEAIFDILCGQNSSISKINKINTKDILTESEQKMLMREYNLNKIMEI